MVICPRCAQQVDETTRTTCPHCFTPLTAVGAPQTGQAPPAQPYPGAPGQPSPLQANSPPLSRSAGTRVSLTGEVIHDDAGVPPPSYVGGNAPGRPPAGAAPGRVGLAQPRAAYGASLSEAPTKSGGGGTIVAVLIGLVILAGAGVGGWWFLTPHTTPKMVVQQFDTAIAAQDWKAVYPLVELPADIKAKCPDATSFASYMTTQLDQARKMPMAAVVLDGFFKAYQTAEVGEPTIDGDSAKVPIKLKYSIAALGMNSEKSVDQQIPLHKVNGAWKIDSLTSTMPGGMGSGSR